MEDKIVHFTLRISRETLDKFGYISEYEGRTKNKELLRMIKKRIAAFEKEHGEINPDDIDSILL